MHSDTKWVEEELECLQQAGASEAPQHASCFLDDILITGCDDPDHLKNLEVVLSHFGKFSLHVQGEKCEFLTDSLEYLGHIIDATVLHKSPEKLCSNAEAPAPTNVGNLCSFLGLINMATPLIPLHALLHKGYNGNGPWSVKKHSALHRNSSSHIVMTHYDPKMSIRLACDASP